jgi:hypothetical protein
MPGGLKVCVLVCVCVAFFCLFTDYQPGSALPVSSSAIAIGEDFEVYTHKVIHPCTSLL